jgi:hypothetical protein
MACERLSSILLPLGERLRLSLPALDRNDHPGVLAGREGGTAPERGECEKRGRSRAAREPALPIFDLQGVLLARSIHSNPLRRSGGKVSFREGLRVVAGEASSRLPPARRCRPGPPSGTPLRRGDSGGEMRSRAAGSPARPGPRQRSGGARRPDLPAAPGPAGRRAAGRYRGVWAHRGSSSVGPSSTIRPRYMTATRSADVLTTLEVVRDEQVGRPRRSRPPGAPRGGSRPARGSRRRAR